MRFATKKYRWMRMLLFIITLFCIVSVTANAQGKASITIFYHGVTPQEESIALSGADFVLYKVASYFDDTWKYQGLFSDCTVSLDDMTASGQLKAAKELYTYAKERNLNGTSKKTGEDGYAVFTELEEGLYLIAPTADISCKGGVFRSDPFLAWIPERNETGVLSYDINVEPKNEWVSDDEPTNPQSPTTQPGYQPGSGTQSSVSTTITTQRKSEYQTGRDLEGAQIVGKEIKRQSQSQSKDESKQKSGILYSLGQRVKTGDNAQILMFVGILVVSTAAILFWIFQKYRKKELE